jgi:soluble P-type ATPase
MKNIEIPGFGTISPRYLVCDYSGTLSVDGKLCEGVRERLNKIAEILEIHILTADTHGLAASQLDGIKCDLHLLNQDNQDSQKESYVLKLGPELVIAIGNGVNDRKMLKGARIGIAVCLAEGLASDSLMAADLIVTSATDALDLVLNPNRLIATLRN